MKDFALILKDARKELDFKVRDIAESIGVDASLYSRFESGERVPSRQQLKKISGVLNIPEKKLVVSWLSEKIYKEASDEPYFLEALRAAEDKIVYQTKKKSEQTPQLISPQLLSIDQLKLELNKYRHLDSFKVVQALELEYTFNSNKIEGNTLSIQETELVINQGLTISGKSMREHLEAINHTEAIAFIKDIVQKKQPITERLVLQLHALVLRGIDRENAGVYRKLQVRIGGSSHVPPDAWKVPSEMEVLFEWYREHQSVLHPIVLAAEMHERLVSIHPFIDGNGRTSRLLMNLIMLQHGYVIANIKGEKDERLKYYEVLDASRKNNKEAFIQFITEIEYRCMAEYLSILKGSR